MSRLVVDLNGGAQYDVAPAAERVETRGDFAVEFRNHGPPVHVHLRPDDALAGVTAVTGTNHYVEAESALVVEVPVETGAAGTAGRLDLVSGYGKGSASVTVAITEPDDVSVDERLEAPPGGGEDGSPDEAPPLLARVGGARLPRPSVPAGRGTAALVALGVVALGLAAIAAATAPGPTVVAGIFVVLVGLGVAGYVMAR